jgi:hypothetical protein
VQFKLPARNDTCRFRPAFRITAYTASRKPDYVYCYKTDGSNMLTLIDGYQYNSYVNRSTNELILQVDSVYCDTTIFFISADRTLAVSMAGFTAVAGDASVNLKWKTESEENNLGFFLYRRIKPQFLDSVSRLADSSARQQDTTEDQTAHMLVKTRKIGVKDTSWVPVNGKIIYGAMSGVSYGKREYSWLDKRVQNDVEYEYKLVAVDFNNKKDAYDKYAIAKPVHLLPLVYALWGNFPNPFRQQTIMKYDLPIKTKVMLNIYNMQGRLVRQVVHPDKVMKPGFYQCVWDGRDDYGRKMASGPYIYRIVAQGYAKARVLVMVK